MRNRMPVTLLLTVILILGSLGPATARAQGPWPPVRVDLKPISTGHLVTFEIKVTNLVDWTLADFTLKCSLPADTTFVEGHADFDGAVAEFDGQDASFFVVTLPSAATLGFRYIVDATNVSGKVYAPQIWTGWKGRLPGQALFDLRSQPIEELASIEKGPGNTLDKAVAGGLKVIAVHGTAYEQGRERGQALPTEIKEQVRAHLTAALPQAYGGSRPKWLEAVHKLANQAAPEVVEELRGIAEGSGVSLDDLEIVSFSSYVESVDTSTASSVACSVLATVGNANQSNPLILGRHQDLVGLTAPPVFIVRHFDDNRPPRLDLTQPASLDMALSITADGLFWEGHPVFSKETVPTPASDLLSLTASMLRQARTPDEVQQGLLAQPRLKAMNVTIASLPQGEVRILELSSTRYAVIRPDKDGVLISTNHFMAPDLSDLRPPSVNRSVARYERLDKLATSNLGAITPQTIQTIMEDPEVSRKTGVTVVVDAATKHILYWDEIRNQWFDIALSDVFAG